MNINNNFSTTFQGGKTGIVKGIVREQMKDGSELFLRGTFDKKFDTFTHMEAYKLKNGRIIGGYGEGNNKGISDENLAVYFEKIEKSISDGIDLVGELFSAIRLNAKL